MKSSLENLSSIRQKITIEVSASKVDKAFDAAIEKVRKEAKIPGFRKGKVPDDVILKRFGNDVNSEATKEVINASFPEAIKQTDAKPISDPQIELSKPIEKGKPFTYYATIEIYPEVKPVGYEGLSLTRQKVDVKDEEVEAELKRLQHQMTQLEPAEGKEISHGIVATIDFKGTAGGKAFPGSEAENYVVDFGAGALLPEFEKEIKGMKAGEEKDIAFHYPTDFFRREIAGKKGEFKVKVKELRTKVVPEINDEFAKSLGDFKDLKAVRADLKKRILEYKEAMEASQLREQAIRALIAKNQNLEVPTVLVDSELGNMLEQIKRQHEMQGQKFDTSKIDAKKFVAQNVKEATDRARGYMLARAVAAEEKLEVTEEEMENRINQMAVQSRSTPQQIRDYLNKNKMLDNLSAQILFEKTLDLMVSKAKIKTEKPKKEKK